MKAVVCEGFGPPETLVVRELPALAAEPGHVVVSVRAASLNFPDVLVIADKYHEKPGLPFTPGAEMAGVVKAVGPGVTRFRVGDRVMGVVGQGAFAQECVAAADRLMPVPPGMDFAVASGFTMTYATAYHALRQRIAVRPGETLLVLGAAGGVGLAAIEIGRILGLTVIACASDPEKLELCRVHGANEGIDYVHEDLRGRIRALTNGAGVDVIFDAVGGQYAEAALRSSAWRARHLVIGFASGEIPRVPLNLPLLMERDIVGVHWGAWAARAPAEHIAAMEQLAQWHAQGRLRPRVAATYALENVAAALRAMMERKALGKIVVAVSS